METSQLQIYLLWTICGRLKKKRKDLTLKHNGKSEVCYEVLAIHAFHLTSQTSHIFKSWKCLNFYWNFIFASFWQYFAYPGGSVAPR